MSATRREVELDLAHRLGLNPAETTEVRVEITPGKPAYVVWSGRRDLTADELLDVVLAINGPTS